MTRAECHFVVLSAVSHASEPSSPWSGRAMSSVVSAGVDKYTDCGLSFKSVITAQASAGWRVW